MSLFNRKKISVQFCACKHATIKPVNRVNHFTQHFVC